MLLGEVRRFIEKETRLKKRKPWRCVRACVSFDGVP
jgi:hypothetical protein